MNVEEPDEPDRRPAIQMSTADTHDGKKQKHQILIKDRVLSMPIEFRNADRNSHEHHSIGSFNANSN